MGHAVSWALGEGYDLDAVCCIYATAPFIHNEDLQRGLKSFESGNWDYVFSATNFSAPILRAFTQGQDGGVTMLFPENYATRSQDLTEALHDAGQFYWGCARAWTEKVPVFSQGSTTTPIPSWRVQDIDTDSDWERAEILAPLILDRKG